MSEEMNKELETEVIAGVTAEEPVETMEDFAAELEASYKTLNKRNIELSEEESGQGMVEYGLIIVLIAIAVITALTGVGKNLTDKFDEIGKAIGGAQTP